VIPGSTGFLNIQGTVACPGSPADGVRRADQIAPAVGRAGQPVHPGAPPGDPDSRSLSRPAARPALASPAHGRSESHHA
jgi:hypothetical protein